MGIYGLILSSLTLSAIEIILEAHVENAVISTFAVAAGQELALTMMTVYLRILVAFLSKSHRDWGWMKFKKKV